jgi:hypothetical protein
MKSLRNLKTVTGLVLSAMLAAVSHAQVTLSDFSNFTLNGTYAAWETGIFTSGATAFTVQANANGGGFKNLAPAVNASGNNTISVRMNVNSGNVADKFNIVLFDGDGTARVFRFENIGIGNNQTFTKNVANFLQDNAPGSVPGLNLATLTAFHLQGTFENNAAMNMTFDNLSLVVAAVPPIVPDTIVNGDFSIPNGSGWATETVGPVITFPATGGNLGGCAIIDATVTSNFAAIKAFNGDTKSFASLGLTPGQTATIQMDMKILEGSNIGGLRLVGGVGYEFLSRPAIIGSGTEWATYSIPFTVPTNQTGAIFTFVWGFNSKVAFDNIKIVLPGPDQPLQATITQGALLSWTAVASNLYQPQTSSNGTTWTNLGPSIVGTSGTPLFDTPKANFYQVLQSTPSAPQDAVFNGGFETEFIGPENADGWEGSGQFAQRITTPGAARTGDACMELSVDTGTGTGMTLPKVSEISQNIANANLEGGGSGMIVPGNSYTLSFWYKQFASSPTGYVPEYRVTWLIGNAETPTGGGKWQELPTSVTPSYVQATLTGLVAPAGATSALIQIVVKTGADFGNFGKVNIDDLSLVAAGFNAPTVIPSTSIASVEISWPSKTGKSYQVQSSDNLGSWSNFGSVITGNGSLKAVYDSMAIPKNFYRVGVLP